MLESIQLSAHAHWVGAQDPDLKVFDIIMPTEYGTTYNAYMVRGEAATALIDCAKAGFDEQYFERIDSITPLDEIDYVVVNHTEPDHSGLLARLLERAPGIKVVCTNVCSNFVKQILNREPEFVIVKGGDTLELGGATLEFVNAPFLHWPDSMITYLREDRILFSCDVFGSHYGRGAGLFADECRFEELNSAQELYFAVIFWPFKKYVLQMLANVDKLEPTMIAPSHGPVYRRELSQIVELYRSRSADIGVVNSPKRIVLAYVSSYGFTRRLAREIAGTIDRTRFELREFDLAEVSPGEVAAEVNAADAVIVGSPTFNRDVLPPVWSLLTGISAYRAQGKPAAVFGSYGWSGEAVGMMEQRLSSLGFKCVSSVRAVLNPSEAEMNQAHTLAVNLMAAIK